MRRALLKPAAFLLLWAPGLVRADEIYLKGAGRISGKITERNETMILVFDGDGIVGVPLERVERVVEGRSALDEYDERAARLRPEDAAGWRRLGRWAADASLSAQSREAYANVLAAAPDDPEAREALGFVRLNGNWVSEEESYLARGFVKRDGEWISAAQAQALDAAAEATQAAERRAALAEAAAALAQADAREAERRAQEAQSQAYPMYWGGWGYGLSYWPSTTYVARPAVNRPAVRARVPR
jgi:hypothetical protein